MNKKKPFIIILGKGIWSFLTSMLGVFGALLRMFLGLCTLSILLAAAAGMILYIKVKPELDYCRGIAYDKLSQMERQDFRMLSDTEIYDKDGQLIGLINAGHYEYVPISQISLDLQNAYIAQEDRRFKSHFGVDLLATARAGLALIKNRGDITQGGSTITQQVVKNTYLTKEQTFTRKITEILMAPEIEKKFSKADIMEFYCNTNFYGNHCYGVQAASRYYFGKDALDLNPAESAVLVGLSNSPSAYDPIKNPEDALEKRNSILSNMYDEGFLTKEQLDTYTAQSLSIVQEEAEGTNENYQSSYAIHCAALEMMKLEEFPFQYTFETKEEYESYTKTYQNAYTSKTEEIRAGGYQIYTSLDSRIQEMFQAQIDQGLSSFTELQENGKYALQGAGVIVDNHSNYVVAIVGGRGNEDPFNRAYLSARQPGSTIKPLLDYAPAFDTGEYSPSRLVNDHKWENGPSNSSGNYHGDITVREGLTRSLNTVAWQILEDIGVNFGLQYLGEMQFQRITYIDNNIPSLSIGGFTNGLRVVDMAKGYSTLANYGVYNDRTCITGIKHEQNGDLLKDSKPFARQVYQEDSAFITTDILKGVLNEPYGTGYGLALSNDMPAAGKTGTTNSNKDAWFCGYTRYYTAAVWMGYDTPKPMPGIYGSTYAGRIWKNTMDQLHTDLEPWDWDKPETVEERTNEKNGITDYVSTTLELRAQQTLHEKEQRRLREELETAVVQFENKVIETVEDTYWVKEQYENMMAKLNLMDEGAARASLLERVAVRYDEFESIIKDMHTTIVLYEEQKAYEAAEAQKLAEKQAAVKRKELEFQTRKDSFLTALQILEELKYQSPDIKELAEDATEKLAALNSLERNYPETSSYFNRLRTVINNISSLPDYETWQKSEALRLEAERQKQAADQQTTENEKKQLQSALNGGEQNRGNEPVIGPGAEVSQ